MAFFCVTPISADVTARRENKNVVDVPVLRRVVVQHLNAQVWLNTAVSSFFLGRRIFLSPLSHNLLGNLLATHLNVVVIQMQASGLPQV